MPIATAVIAVYVMVSASNALHRVPLFRPLPLGLVRAALLATFVGVLLSLAVMTAATVRQMSDVMPVYEENIDVMLEGFAARYGLDRQTLWDELRAVTIDAFDLHQLLLVLLGGFTNIGAVIFLIVVYAIFLMSERAGFDAKLAAAFDTRARTEQVLHVIRQINRRVSDYLAIKTLINVILAALSFVVLWLHGIDFALFWAVVIGLMNYIPYVGSYIGVFFPVVLSVAQFASLPVTLSLTVFLTGAQMIMGNYVEPRWVGRHVNLSPTVVLVALSVWTALWGIPGAILAVPMTSVMAIILGSFPETRWVAILLADKVEDDT